MTSRSAGSYGSSKTLRVALVLVLALAALGGATGVASAQVPGPSGQGDAPTANYAPGDAGAVLPDSESGDGGAGSTPEAGQGDGSSEGESGSGSGSGDAAGPTPAADDSEVERQVEAGSTLGTSLPFTGYAAVPALMLGMLLLAAGVVLRRRVSRQQR